LLLADTWKKGISVLLGGITGGCREHPPPTTMIITIRDLYINDFIIL